MKTAVLTIVGVAFLGTLMTGAMPTPEKPAPFQLDLDEALAALGPYEWQILKDESYSRIDIGHSSVTGRRIVATVRVPVDQQSRIRSAFTEEIERQLADAGALLKGEESVSHSEHSARDGGGIEHTEIAAPRWYYGTGKNYGVLDGSLIAHDGRLILTVSYLQ